MPGPPLPPTQTGAVLGDPGAPIRVEMYLDLICPFSRKMWASTVEAKLNEKVGDKVCFIFNQVIQPWHPQGTCVHEAALAVKQCAPDKFFAYCTALFTALDNGRFKDDTTWDLSRAQIYEELLVIAAATGVDRAAVEALLARSPEAGNSGNQMTQMIKWVVKYHRCRGVHVTPTVHVNGLEAGVVSSGWATEQWLEFLKAEGDDFFRGK
jgi:protein-disulfide isomerase